MRIIFFIIAFALALVGCVPQNQFFDVEVYDNADVWELDLSGRTPAVFSIYSQDLQDSTLLHNVSVGMAERLEADRQMQAGAIEVYAIPKEDFAGFDNAGAVAVDTTFMNNLMLTTNADMQLFVENLIFGEVQEGRMISLDEKTFLVPYNITFTIYDALIGNVKLSSRLKDTLYFKADLDATAKDLYIYVNPNLPQVSKKIGESISYVLSRQWKTQSRTLITYQGSSVWMKPYNLALENKWKEAIKLWMPLTESENARKAAYAAYNIAVACEMLDEFTLSKKWIEFSLGKYKFNQAVSFSKKLSDRYYKL